MTQAIVDNSQQQEFWYRRIGDGSERSCNPGSMAFKFMSRDPLFIQISGPGGNEIEKVLDNSSVISLDGMSAIEMMEFADSILEHPDVEVLCRARRVGGLRYV